MMNSKTRVTLLPFALFIGVTMVNQISQVSHSLPIMKREKVKSDAPQSSWIEELASSFVRLEAQSSSIVINITDVSYDYDDANPSSSHQHHHHNNNNNNNRTTNYGKVVLKSDEVFMWKGRQRKLCKRLQKESKEGSRSLLFFGVPCQGLHDQHRHGNVLFGLYAMHIAASAHEADLMFVCHEKNDYDNLFWWTQSLPYTIYLKRDLLAQAQQRVQPPPSRSSTCAGMGKIPLQYASDLVTYDLRRMALNIAGPRTSEMKQYASENPELTIPKHSKKQDRLPSKPLHSKMELDSVAIHFRCGDLLGNLNSEMNENYGLMPFYVYTSLLTKKDTTIGIVTAPFDPDYLRKQDVHHGPQCQELVERFRDYVQEHAPWAKVSIRNDPTETIPMVLSRLILADRKSICIRSTFCVFATLASFAQQRIFLEGGVSYFISDISDPGVIRLEQAHTPYMYSHEIHQLGWNDTMQWLLHDEHWHTQQRNFGNGNGKKEQEYR